MTPVQARVLALLPSLARPFGLKSHAEFSAGEDESALVNRDLLVQAKTGTGKTLAFLVPAIEARLQSIEAHAKQAVIDSGRPGDKNLTGQAARAFTRNTVGTLIISPTRELASQIAKEALKLSAHHDDFGVHLFVGGESKARQLGEFTRGRKDIVVATPGRLRDLLESDARVADPMAKAQTVC